MRSDVTRSTPPSSTFTPPNQRSRYSQPNLPTLLVSYNDGRSTTSGSPDRRIRMSQPTLNSSFPGINFVGINRGRLSFPSLRASGDNYTSFKIDEERLSAPNVRSAGLKEQPDVTHVLRCDPVHKRDRLSQPTLVPGDYYPGRGHQRLSQPCLLGSRRDLQTILNSPVVKHKRFSPVAPKVNQRDRLYQLDFGANRINCRGSKELQPAVDLVKFNRDRFSIPELETANDLRLIAGTPKQRFSLDSSLNEPKRRSRLLPIASSPISENLAKIDQVYEGKKAADCLESVLITSTTPLLPRVESVFDPLPPIPIRDPMPVPVMAPVQINHNHSQRMSVPDISTSSLRRLLDPPAKHRHSITGNLRQCLIPAVMKKAKKSDENLRKNTKNDDITTEVKETVQEPPKKNIQRHYSYTYETTTMINATINDSTTSSTSCFVKENMSAVPRKKYLESNFDRNEQVITTVIESEVPMILTSPKSLNKATVYGSETPKWMRKYIDFEHGIGNDQQSGKIGRRNSQNSKRKAWQNSNRDSIDSVDSAREIIIDDADNKAKSANQTIDKVQVPKNTSIMADKKSGKFDSKGGGMIKDTYVTIETGNSYNVNIDNNNANNKDIKVNVSNVNSGRIETDICRLYGLDCDESESDESTSI